ncbi:hypothetical protein Ae201684P_011136 [Aphanomyces euteiches]|nr:hypothetical protein Ae201684P_011136 [Aphanomyces euteiches]
MDLLVREIGSNVAVALKRRVTQDMGHWNRQDVDANMQWRNRNRQKNNPSQPSAAMNPPAHALDASHTGVVEFDGGDKVLTWLHSQVTRVGMHTLCSGQQHAKPAQWPQKCPGWPRYAEAHESPLAHSLQSPLAKPNQANSTMTVVIIMRAMAVVK